MNRYIFVCSALIVMLFPLASSASHYALEDAGLADQSTVDRLAGLGISDTEALWKATATPRDQKALARKAGVDPKVVAGWHSFCDLLRIEGVGPKIARLLTFSGVRDLVALSRQKPVELLARTKAQRGRVPELGKFPDETNMAAWIGRAAEIVKADASARRNRR